MPKVSACVITYDEEENIEACLDALSFCDELIVVDSMHTIRRGSQTAACWRA